MMMVCNSKEKPALYYVDHMFFHSSNKINHLGGGSIIKVWFNNKSLGPRDLFSLWSQVRTL